MLTAEQATEIYSFKIKMQAEANVNLTGQALDLALRGKSGLLSKKYHITPRAIRDVWNRNTWGFATIHLWQEETSTHFPECLVDSSVK